MMSTSYQLFEKALNNPIGIWYNEIELKGEELLWDWICIYIGQQGKTQKT